MTHFNEHILEIDIMRLFENDSYIYIRGEVYTRN